MKHDTHGFTLVEFLISLSLGLYLVTVTTSLYMSLQKTTLLFQSIHEMGSNSCFALSALTRDIRMAGFIGVPRLLDVKVDNQKDFTPTQSLMGWHRGLNTLAKSLPIPLSNIESDVLLIQYAEPNGIAVVEAHGAFIKCHKRVPFHPDRIQLIADCQHAEALCLSNVQLRHSYQKEAILSPLYRIIYYVAPTDRKNAQQDTINALYRRDLNAPDTNPIELVEGVEKLEIRYGMLTREAHLTYLKADAVDDWLKVRTVQLTLHFSSLENMHFALARSSKNPSPKQDKRLKRQWQQTVMIRTRSAWL